MDITKAGSAEYRAADYAVVPVHDLARIWAWILHEGCRSAVGFSWDAFPQEEVSQGFSGLADCRRGAGTRSLMSMKENDYCHQTDDMKVHLFCASSSSG